MGVEIGLCAVCVFFFFKLVPVSLWMWEEKRKEREKIQLFQNILRGTWNMKGLKSFIKADLLSEISYSDLASYAELVH